MFGIRIIAFAAIVVGVTACNSSADSQSGSALDTLESLSCETGEIARWNGVDWRCADDLGTDTLSELNCGTGDVAKWDGSTWSCDQDLNADSLDALASYCPPGSVVVRTDERWVCRQLAHLADVTLASLAPKCSEEEIPKWRAGEWICTDDFVVENTDTLAELGCTVGGTPVKGTLEWMCSSEEVRYLGINAIDFHPDPIDPGWTITQYSEALARRNVGSSFAMASIHLPHGARIEGVTCMVYATPPDNEITMTLLITRGPTGVVKCGSATSVESESEQLLSTDLGGCGYSVDNEVTVPAPSFAMFRVVVESQPTDQSSRVYGCHVAYRF